MSSIDPNQDDDHNAADDIAAEITKILVKAFVSKEGREPTADEVQMLIEELTEERIESMLSGGFDAGDDDAEGEDVDVSDQEEDGSDREEDGSVSPKEHVESEMSLSAETATNLKRDLADSINITSTCEKSEDENADNKSKKAKTVESDN